MSSTPSQADFPLTLSEACAQFTEGRTSSDLVSTAIARADELDARLGTYAARFDDAALECARRLDRERADGRVRGPLHGVPIAVKDNIFTREGETAAQSSVAPPQWSAGQEGPAIQGLRRAGAVVMGKSTTMEYACGMPDATKTSPLPRNPWDLKRWAGGSSSGTANGIAAGLLLGGVGSDTGGSIRYPASYCGVTGYKPTHGLVSTNGMIPLAASLDVMGPLARSARDCAVLLAAMTQASGETDKAHGLPGETLDSLAGVRIGVDYEASQGDVESRQALERAAAVFECLGATVSERSIPMADALKCATVVTMYAEAFAEHRSALRDHWDEFGTPTRIFLASGAMLDEADYLDAVRVRRFVREAAVRAFCEVDFIATSTVVGSPPLIGTESMSGAISGMNTQVWNGVGFPAVSIPVGLSEFGLPLGVQIAGAPHQDARLLAVAAAFQSVTSWHLQVPPLDHDATRPLTSAASRDRVLGSGSNSDPRESFAGPQLGTS